MQITNMPLFDMFLPIIQTRTIEKWTANDFWKNIKLTKRERTIFNRQRMYRILRKLVENGYLTKTINSKNLRKSSFTETKKIDLFRKNNILEKENAAIEKKITHIDGNIKNLDDKQRVLRKVVSEFPHLSSRIELLRRDLTHEIQFLELYKEVLQTLRS